MPALLSDEEATRLDALRQYDLLDTLPEQAFDHITKAAAAIRGMPISLISLTDYTRQMAKVA